MSPTHTRADISDTVARRRHDLGREGEEERRSRPNPTPEATTGKSDRRPHEPRRARPHHPAPTKETLSRRLGAYEIVRRLGVGGMAETFLALRQGPAGFEQRVCLKRVLPAFRDDQAFSKLFAREARIAAGLRHANVVSVIEHGKVGGVAYLALELVDGVDLRDHLAARGRALSAAEVAHIGHELALGLRHAHERGVVHRDVSPSNVMLGRTGEVKLTDFGVAKMTQSGEGAPPTTTGPRGKLAYMAPEQIRGEAVDGRADLFSLGVLLYEALAAARPHRARHEVDLMRRIVEGVREPLAPRAPDAPPALVRLIEELLELNPCDRPSHAEEVARRLASVPGRRAAGLQIGREIDALRGGPSTREHVMAVREIAGDTRLSPVPRGVASAGTRPRLGPKAIAAGSMHPPGPGAESEQRGSLNPKSARGVTRVALVSLGFVGIAALMFMLGAQSRPAGEDMGPTAAMQRDAAPGSTPPAAAETLESESPEAERSTSLSATSRSFAVDDVDVARARRSSPRHREPSATAARQRTPPDDESMAPSSPPPPDSVVEGPASASMRVLVPAEVLAPQDDATTEDASAAAAPATPGVESDPAPARPSRLRITVVPWGDVWVDGDYMGRAPVQIVRPPGRYVISAGTERPTVRRAVRLGSGQSRRVELELDAWDDAQ